MSRELRSVTTAFRREIKLALKRPADIWLSVGFAVLVTMLFGIALGGSPNKLAAAGPAVLFTTLLLASFLAVSRMFAEDLEDGSLDQMLISPSSLTAILYGKVLAFWCLHGLSLVLATPILALLLRLDMDQLPLLLLTCTIVTLGLNLLGLVGAALTVRLRAGAMLLALIVLPLMVPLLVFGLGAVMSASQGESGIAGLALAAAETLLLLALAPAAAALGLRITSE